MTNRERLAAFFDAENRRDWEAYRAFLDPNVVWVLHGAKTETVTGADAYMARIRAAYRGSNVTFHMEKRYESADGDRIVTILRNSLGAVCCDIFAFQNGLICREYEFLL